MPHIQYFKIKKERHDYLGERFFKVDYDSDKVVQVCLSPGDVKKGKSNTLGVYAICKLTFFTNYAGRYVDKCTAKEYKKQFKKAVNLLE